MNRLPPEAADLGADRLRVRTTRAAAGREGGPDRRRPPELVNLRRVPIRDASSLDDVLALVVTSGPDARGEHVLIFDADNTLAPQGAPHDEFAALVNGAIDRFQALPNVARVIVLSNGAERGVSRMISRGNKPWTTRRRLGLDTGSSIIVVGDQILTDGIVAWRFGGTFIHLVIDEEREAARQAAMRAIGRFVAALLFRRSP